MTQDAKSKMIEVRKILKSLEEIIEDHIEDGGDLAPSALIDSALEIYKVYCEEDQDESAS
jgi:hypothetical protein